MRIINGFGVGFGTYSEFLDRVGGYNCVEHLGDAVGVAQAGGVSQADLITSHIEQLLGQVPNLPVVDGARIWASDDDA